MAKKYLMKTVHAGFINLDGYTIGEAINELSQYDSKDILIDEYTDSYEHGSGYIVTHERQETEEEYKIRMEKRKKEREKSKKIREKMRLQLLKECKKYGIKAEDNNDP